MTEENGKASKITFQIDKEKNFSEWYEEILKIADIVDNRYPVKGMLVWKPYGYKALKLMMRIIERLLEENGHEEAYFPMLIPEHVFKKEKEFLEGFGGQSYIVTHVGENELNEKLYLRPTSETAMYEMFHIWVRSKSDLPIRIYQTVNIFRYETKQTKPILRVREIIKFKEAHTAHATYQEAEEQVKKAIEIYKQFYDALLIPYIILKTPRWDTFSGAEYNYDFITVLPDGKAVELGSVINLGTKFAKAFDITYADDKKQKHVYQTCYGISERTLAAALSIHGDNKGLIIPPQIAPIQIVIIPIIYKNKETPVRQKANQIQEILEKHGYRVYVDSSDKTPGNKYYYWEAKGAPIRIDIGPRDLENRQVTLSRRDTQQKIQIPEDELVTVVEKTFAEISQNLKRRAQEYLKTKIHQYKTLSEYYKQHKGKKGIFGLPWCGDETCGQQLEQDTDTPALGYTEEEVKELKCAICGKSNVKWIYFGRTY
ncbi:MAG: proline--tRNA ligase [Candidatus Odinarchaeia archaeon]